MPDRYGETTLQRSSFHEARVRAAELAATGALTRGRMS
ncbi:hypothetical protein AVV73_gp074 [Mycobacterium phage CaptainTrips]|uniref:Uncharacterized protein n=1 Tax=Mycobacterium phage CaptainTrips TaxID=1556289 RepID=A0A0A0RKL1_9CAUD|nr:hypothetical protein AVV73_gp074 [Mycobacterium phage CaptainTrips]AIW02466.1 hypothetical protein PBI_CAPTAINTRIPS_74 [Mycobacterium phage CaptainTrips]